MPARKLAEIHLASADWFAENVREMMPAARQLLAAGLDSCERGVENLVEDSVKKIAWQKAKQIMRSHGGNNPDALTEIHMASSLQGFFLGVAYGQCLTPEALRLPTAKGGAR